MSAEARPSLFHEIHGLVVLCTKGIYTEHSLWTFRNQLFARKGGSFLRLMDHGVTSQTGTTLVHLHTPHTYHTVTGTLELVSANNVKEKKAG